jgi:hypothetical protein
MMTAFTDATLVAVEALMKAKYIEVGDQLFNPEGVPCVVQDRWSESDEIIVLAFDGGLGMKVSPERELLVARKGQVL